MSENAFDAKEQIGKRYWWYQHRTKIIFNNPQEGVVLTPFLGIGGLTFPRHATFFLPVTVYCSSSQGTFRPTRFTLHILRLSEGGDRQNYIWNYLYFYILLKLYQ